jgi:hypothetical protein
MGSTRLVGDEDRASILARRARFIASALAGLAMTTCGDSDSPPQPCLDAPPANGSSGSSDDGGTSSTSGTGGQGGSGGEPQPCLIAPLGGGGMGGGGMGDAGG